MLRLTTMPITRSGCGTIFRRITIDLGIRVYRGKRQVAILSQNLSGVCKAKPSMLPRHIDRAGRVSGT
jgi:hypothetical protein